MGLGCPNTAHSKTSYCLQDVTTPMSPLTTHGSWDQTDNTTRVTTTCIERSPCTLTLRTFQSILDYCDGHRLYMVTRPLFLEVRNDKSSDGIPYLEYCRGVTHSRPVEGTCTPVCPQDPPSSSSYACVPAWTLDLRIVSYSVFPQNYNSQKYVDQLETPSSNDRDRRRTIHVTIRR